MNEAPDRSIEVVVRQADSNDIRELVWLMKAFYAESSFPLDREWAASSFERLLSEPSLGCAWLARVAGRAVGHAVLSVRYTMEHAALGGYVDDLYVAPAFRRQRIASLLLRALVQECHRRACASLHVEVGGSNIAALATYRKFGLAPMTDGRVLLSGALRAADCCP
jgi:ribosomal protein S18 acetylase RimI-like enzyme